MAKLNSKTIKKLASFLDDLTTFHGFLEVIDGPAYRIILNTLNNKFGDEIPDDLNELIRSALDAIESGDYDKASKELADFLAGIIKTPLIDGTDEEKQVYEAILKEIELLIEKFLKTKR
ncbi:MAG: hypothetical protein GWP19_10415 [Planctomycetia bacterium]|nr:hypothetical protein [Planctomycetia bacterium]